MAARKSQQYVTGGRLWGAERVRLQVSLSQLAEASGVPKGSLSLMEHGRLIPTSEEYDAVKSALAALSLDALADQVRTVDAALVALDAKAKPEEVA